MPLTSKLGGGSLTRSDLFANALKNGWRSGLEESLAAYLDERNIPYQYEEHKLVYTVPERQATYTPDFYVTTRSGKVIIIETKGRFVTADRQKMLLVKSSTPILIFGSSSRTQTQEFPKNLRRPTPLGARSMAFCTRLRLPQRNG